MLVLSQLFLLLLAVAVNGAIASRFKVDDDDAIENVIDRLDGGANLTEALKLWKDGIVPYIISKEFKGDDIQLILDAMSAFQPLKNLTCIRFVPYNKTVHTSYANITTGKGDCHSDIGRQETVNHMHLGMNCLKLGRGVILHELMHTIGFQHEHQRPDREDNIVILDGMRKESEMKYRKRDWENAQDACEEYDFESIMHCPMKENGVPLFKLSSKVDQSRTNLTHLSGRRDQLSKLDIKKINRMYKCGKDPKKKTLMDLVKDNFGRSIIPKMMKLCKRCNIDNRNECLKMVAQFKYCFN